MEFPFFYSLGFSPSELLFGHAVHGPLKILQEEWLATDQSPSPAKSVLDYVTSFREWLHTVCDLAKSSLTYSQSDMKSRYDQKSVQHTFIVGDKVLVLLPIPGSALQDKFSGPYAIV